MSAIAASLTLSACALTSAGVSPGDERNFSRTLNDESVERLIGARLKRAEGAKFKKVEVEVAQGIALLAGNVDTAEDRVEAERIAWSAPHIVEVGNEIKVGESLVGFSRGTKDKVLGTSVRRRLITAGDVKARNVNIEAHNGVVYLLGVARTPEELTRITEIASTTNGAREVVSYITVHDGAVPAAPQNFAALPQGAIPQSSFPQASLPQTSLPQTSIPQTSLPLAGAPLAGVSGQRAVPSFLSDTPQIPSQISPQAALPALPPAASAAPVDPLAPFYRDAITGERIELDPNTQTIPFRPTNGLPGGGLTGALPSAPNGLPNNIGAEDPFRIGVPGETVSVIESAPYYIDPDTGAQIPVNYIR